MLDTISDMLTRIRNAQRAGHSTVEIPFSNRITSYNVCYTKLLRQPKDAAGTMGL